MHVKSQLILALALVPALGFADELSNPYMIPIKINMQECIKQNMSDCLQSICLATPESCHAQCTLNASDKCRKLAGQNIYED
jgi:hypothetical protein